MDTAYCEIELPAAGDEKPLSAAFAQPAVILRADRHEDLPTLLAQVSRLAADGYWLPGFVAYEAAAAFDAAFPQRPPPAGLPLAMFAAFDRPAPARARKAGMWGHWRDIVPASRSTAAMNEILADIGAGRFYQVNLSTRLRAPWSGDAAALFDALRQAQPDAYSMYLEFERWRICSVSPELFFHYQPATDAVPPRLTLRPMKGTAARHEDAGLDEAARTGLRASVKNVAENLMIVDLLRNDASRIAEPGSVRTTSLFDVEPWATVWQMTSTIVSRPRAACGLAELFAALFPCGSVTGAPKIEAMRAIGSLEATPRGVYCGAIGVVRPGGEALFNVGIRTVVIDAEQEAAECGIGSGIVADSKVAEELDEWHCKQRFLLAACPPYGLFETLLLRRGRYWLLAEHMSRLQNSAQALGFEFDRDQVLAALQQEATQHPSDDWRVRLSLEPTGRVAVSSERRGTSPATARVAWAGSAVASDNPWLRHKTSRRQTYSDLAVAEVFDTLLFNERGEATEFTRGNLVAKLGTRLLTPAADSGLLPGTLRAALLARSTLHEAVLSIAEIEAAERLWFINSLRGAIPVELDRKMAP